MKAKKEAPSQLELLGEQINHLDGVRRGKDREKLSYRQKKVYDLLRTGKHSTTDITIKLGYGDPRSYIRELREREITVQDEWVQNGDVRYKRYWIDEPIKSRVNDIHTVGEVMQTNFGNLFERRNSHD